MHSKFLAFATLIVAVSPTLAQEAQQPEVTVEQRKLTSDEKAAQIRVLIEKARIRQQAVDRKNETMWSRWTYAVCIGCGPFDKHARVVFTNPLRVLAGIRAADDDERQRASGLISHL
ncbi:hypothetical protein MKK70_02920 [Methylobacterium sp. E-041]|jgi:hypothetical protein|uniref:hypothetical protein n=1 Tax=Methylobacterium sp. E-041 TaxID=2836573 RepID=UPI001FB96F4F|nr:hypothetical protein [Methylobacterium sp. E-041]MCJ2104351.1 hypothetical protein [Methylobacterium sp. E-041]